MQTTSQAIESLRRPKTQREDGTLPVLSRTPKFCDFVSHHLEAMECHHGELFEERWLWSKKDRQRNHFCERNIVRK